MQLRAISFQKHSKNPNEPFSQTYLGFMQSRIQPVVYPAVEAQQLEALRRQQHLLSVTAELVEELKRKAKEGKDRTEQHCTHILEFLQLLENSQSEKTMWVCTSHYDVSFHDRDYQEYAESCENESAFSFFVQVYEVKDLDWRFRLTFESPERHIEVASAAEAASVAFEVIKGLQ
jgi:hypothetical protein